MIHTVAVGMIKKIDDIKIASLLMRPKVAVGMIKKIDDIAAIARSVIRCVAVGMIKKIDDIVKNISKISNMLQFEGLKRLTIF